MDLSKHPSPSSDPELAENRPRVPGGLGMKRFLTTLKRTVSRKGRRPAPVAKQPTLENLYNDERYYDVIVAVNNNSAATNSDIGLRAQSYYMLGEFEKALADYAIAARELSTKMPFEYFQRARATLNKLKRSPTEASSFWYSCSDPTSLEMEDVHRRLLAGELDGTEEAFSRILEKIFQDPSVRRAWLHAFNLLVRGIRGDYPGAASHPPPRRTVIVSGMGWSGSGAVFDYLRGYSDIFMVRGETSALEGNGGFRYFLEASKNREECIRHSAGFFFRNMLGFLPMRSSDCFKELMTARSYSTGERTAKPYSEGAAHVVEAMVELVQASGGDSPDRHVRLQSLCNAITDNMITFMAPRDKLVLLDNCIHIGNISLARYLSNTVIICCFRDPRSNYLALRKEFPGFNQTAEEYISTYRRQRAKFNRDVNDDLRRHMELEGSRVEAIGFEEFVVSEARRRELVALLGLPEIGKETIRYFKPWQSFRNTQLHLYNDAPEEAHTVGEALSEYCIDFRAVSAKSAASGSEHLSQFEAPGLNPR